MPLQEDKQEPMDIDTPLSTNSDPATDPYYIQRNQAISNALFGWRRDPAAYKKYIITMGPVQTFDLLHFLYDNKYLTFDLGDSVPPESERDAIKAFVESVPYSTYRKMIAEQDTSGLPRGDLRYALIESLTYTFSNLLIYFTNASQASFDGALSSVDLSGSTLYDIIAENGFSLSSVSADSTSILISCENLQFYSNATSADLIDNVLEKSTLIDVSISTAFHMELSQCTTEKLSLENASLINFHVSQGVHKDLSFDNANVYPISPEDKKLQLYFNNVEDVSNLSLVNLNQGLNSTLPEGILPATLALQGENNLTGANFNGAYLALEPAQIETTTWTDSSFVGTSLVSTFDPTGVPTIMTGDAIMDFLAENGIPALNPDNTPVAGSQLSTITFTAPTSTDENVSTVEDKQTRVTSQSMFKRRRLETTPESAPSDRRDEDQDNVREYRK